MQKIYSKKYSKKLLHIIVRKEDIVKGRQNLISESEFLQCALLNLDAGTTFKPHKHKWNITPTMNRIAQESWVVIQGSVEVMFYDDCWDNDFLDSFILKAGDASFTLAGGHNYKILEDETIVYEMKTGKYISQEHDKEFI